MDIRAAIVDLDGTVYRGEEPITGAAEAVAALRKRGLDLLFLTNNPTRTRASYVERLAAQGIDADESEILSAGTVTTEYLRATHPDAAVYVVGSDGLREQFRAGGVTMTDDHDTAEVVVTSHTYGFDYEAMTHGAWACEGADALVGTDPDITYPGGDGRDYPGSGAITNAVATVARREPDHVLGKPAPETLAIALDHLDATPEECLVVGDTPETDIALGARAGMTTVLVCTGTTTRADLPTDPAPDHVLDGLVDLPQLLDGDAGPEV